MTPRARVAALLLAGLAAAGAPAQTPPAPDRAVVMTGTVRARDAEAIFAPMAESSPVTLRKLAKDGAVVQPGDVLVRIDPGGALSQQQSLVAQIAQTRARIQKELAELAVRESDAELALLDAQAAFARAEIDAAIPPDYIARIDLDRYQGELDRARRDVELKRGEAAAATAALARRKQDGELEVAKLQADLDYAEAGIALAEQKAESGGVAIFDFNAWTGQRYQEGSTTNAGQRIGEVVRPGAFDVRAYAFEPDRRGLAVGQAVSVGFDAIAGRTVPGRITRVGNTPQAKAEWGSGRYFVVDIALTDGHGLGLLPGMSTRVTAVPAAAAGEDQAP